MPLANLVTHQDDEKLRRRQVKREQLMKKRKNMEERLEEEASKMAQLTESAKKKGESKFMSEAAKRDAEERIRVEGEIVAQLELQAVQMAAHRATMQRQLEECEDREVADTEASSVALKAKRTLLQERMRQEEEELKTLSESAKRKVILRCALNPTVSQPRPYGSPLAHSFAARTLLLRRLSCISILNTVG